MALLQTRLALKVDVDTLVGTREGLPRLAEIMATRSVAASFFLSLGPDNSGRAIFRVLTRPGFLAKQLRNKAPAAYGLKTMLYGTLLPAPIIGTGLEATVRNLAAAGHEVGLHAWDHVTWHDRLWKMSALEVRAEVDRGVAAFEALTGARPRAFAAPAWRIDGRAVAALEAADCRYISATRGTCPFFPTFGGRDFHILEIPTTLPTADEVLGRAGVTPGNLDRYFLNLIREPGLHILTIHAEMEGRGLAPAFGRFLDAALDRGVFFTRLSDVAEDRLARPDDIPRAEVTRAVLPGRPGEVSFQGQPRN